jgi:LPXTG-motif cell wall-anchored protein
LIKLPLLVFAGAAIVGGLLVGGLRRKEVMGAAIPARD